MTKYFRFKSFYELQKQAQKEYLEVNDRLMTEDEVIAFVEEEGTNYEHLYHTCDVRMYEDKKKKEALKAKLQQQESSANHLE